MPSSLFEGKIWTSDLLAWLAEHTSVRRALDVGVGEGTYCRYFQPQLPHVEWVGLEAWAPYVAEYKLETFYSQIVVADARYVNWNKLGRFDIAFLGDILEHMSKADALEVFHQASQAARFVLISIPIVHMPQEDVGGNPFERHVKDDWTHEEVLTTFPNILAHHCDSALGVYVVATGAEEQALLREASETLTPGKLTALLTQAEWHGNLAQGAATVKIEQEGASIQYALPEFMAHFETQPPENTMAFQGSAVAVSFLLAFLEGFRADYPHPIHVLSSVTIPEQAARLVQLKGSYLELTLDAELPEGSQAFFEEKIEAAKRTCPIYQTLASQGITLKTHLHIR